MLILAVAAVDLHKVHCTPVYLSNSDGIFDVEGYVPKETIVDTGAARGMASRTFATAVGIGEEQLQRGLAYVTASGAIETPVGNTKKKLKFTLGRGTEHVCL